MARSHERGPTDSGVVLHEKLPVPTGRDSEPRVAKRPSHPGGGGGGGTSKPLYAILGAAVIAGGAVGYFLRPMVAPDARVAERTAERDAANELAKTEQERAGELDRRIALAKIAALELEKKLAAAEQARAELAAKVKGVETKAKEVDGDKAKIAKALERGAGTISVQGDTIHVLISDALLFRPNDDQLTTRGKQVMGKLAFALKADVPDRLVWVQGHTDDQPVAVAKKPPAKGAPPSAAPRFATNWELSSARALEVVHYLQDTAKLEPARLAALAFSQYQPVSKTNKAANRRIELVLAPNPNAKVTAPGSRPF
jgi:flagellar motor protein MotB